MQVQNGGARFRSRDSLISDRFGRVGECGRQCRRMHGSRYRAGNDDFVLHLHDGNYLAVG
jgi:hypothetical protein